MIYDVIHCFCFIFVYTYLSLSLCNINKATIKNSMFQNAIITYSRLKDTIFSGCDIRGVEFFGCNTEDALFTNVHEF